MDPITVATAAGIGFACGAICDAVEEQQIANLKRRNEQLEMEVRIAEGAGLAAVLATTVSTILLSNTTKKISDKLETRPSREELRDFTDRMMAITLGNRQ